jgi:hypothetical protein
MCETEKENKHEKGGQVWEGNTVLGVGRVAVETFQSKRSAVDINIFK